jgi:hypothetical protein
VTRCLARVQARASALEPGSCAVSRTTLGSRTRFPARSWLIGEVVLRIGVRVEEPACALRIERDSRAVTAALHGCRSEVGVARASPRARCSSAATAWSSTADTLASWGEPETARTSTLRHFAPTNRALASLRRHEQRRRERVRLANAGRRAAPRRTPRWSDRFAASVASLQRVPAPDCSAVQTGLATSTSKQGISNGYARHYARSRQHRGGRPSPTPRRAPSVGDRDQGGV